MTRTINRTEQNTTLFFWKKHFDRTQTVYKLVYCIYSKHYDVGNVVSESNFVFDCIWIARTRGYRALPKSQTQTQACRLADTEHILRINQPACMSARLMESSTTSAQGCFLSMYYNSLKQHGWCTIRKKKNLSRYSQQQISNLKHILLFLQNWPQWDNSSSIPSHA